MNTVQKKKPCRSCGTPTENSSSAGWLCILCRAAYNRIYAEKNAASIKAQRAGYYKKNRKSIRKKAAKYVAKNRESVQRKDRERYAADPEKRLFQTKQRLYGIGLVQYREILAAQHGVCRICEKDNGRNRLCIDHDHVTKKIRGLLCNACNVGVGMFKDSPVLLAKAIKYLQETT